MLGFGSASRSFSEEIVQKEVAERGQTCLRHRLLIGIMRTQNALKQGPKAGL